METNLEIFGEYYETKTQIEELQEKLKELQPQVTEELKKLDDNKLEVEEGTFYITTRKNKVYPIETQERIKTISLSMKDQIKKIQEEVEPTVEELEVLTFRKK